MPRPKGARDADYDVKRSALLRKLRTRLIEVDETRPSLRQLAISAGVTVPTLRHYFGTREDLVQAVMEEGFTHGARYFERGAEPFGELRESVLAFLTTLFGVMRDGPQISELFAIGFLEGFYHHRLGPAALNYVIEPPLQALEARLKAHQARGEMVEADVRVAALMLVSPLLVGCLHQNQMFGDKVRPLHMAPVIEAVVDTFMHTYAKPVQVAA